VYPGALDENNVEHAACGECIQRGLARFGPGAGSAQRHPHVAQPHNVAGHYPAGEAQRHAESAQKHEKVAWAGWPDAHASGTAGVEGMGAACGGQRVPMGMLSRKRGAGGAAVEWGGEVFTGVGVCEGWTGQGVCEPVVSSPHKRQRTGFPFSPVI